MLRKLLILCSCLSASVWASVYPLPPEGSNLVGRIQFHQIKQGESMADIAKLYDVGFLSLMAANQGVDPFLPAVGHVLTIPTQVILPNVDHEGVVINLAELRLYYFEPTGQYVHIFPVGIGRIGRDTPEMVTTISQKRPNPTWTPPASIRKEYAAKGIDLPAVVPAGPENPLGDFALRLAHGAGDYLIHGTNKDFGIGMRVSSGCIRMDPKDIKWLFEQVDLGIKVTVVNQPVKFSLEPDRSVYLEAHEPLTRSDGSKNILGVPQELSWWLQAMDKSDAKARAVVLAQNGIPVEIVEPQSFEQPDSYFEH